MLTRNLEGDERARFSSWRRRGGLAGTAFECLLEARPVVQAIFFLLRFLVGASFAGPLTEAGPAVWYGAAAWACVTLSVYLLNGVMDVKEDRANGSGRPVASGRLPVARAAGVSAALAVLGVAGGWAVGPAVGLSAAASLVLGWLYSGPPSYLKRWPAGLTATAVLGGLLTYLAGYASGGGGHASGFLVFSVVMSSWMGLVGQTKDLPDVEGDRLAGRRSGPVAWGEGKAQAVYAASALGLGAAYLAGALLAAPDLLASAAVLMVGAMAVAVLSLYRRPGREPASRTGPYRAFMLAQYGAHLVALLR